MLKEIEIVSENLSEAAAIGLEALEFLENKNPSEEWLKEKVDDD
jgi:hypothetical protein